MAAGVLRREQKAEQRPVEGLRDGADIVHSTPHQGAQPSFHTPQRVQHLPLHAGLDALPLEGVLHAGTNDEGAKVHAAIARLECTAPEGGTGNGNMANTHAQ